MQFNKLIFIDLYYSCANRHWETRTPEQQAKFNTQQIFPTMVYALRKVHVFNGLKRYIHVSVDHENKDEVNGLNITLANR